jgi:HEAT repeat protein
MAMTSLCCSLAVVLAPLLLVAPTPEAGQEDEQLLRAKSVAVDGPGLLAFFEGLTLSDPERAQVQALIRRLGSNDFNEREQATEALIKRGAAAAPLLRAALGDRDPEIVARAQRCLDDMKPGPTPEVLAAAARLLAKRHPDGAAAALLAYIPAVADDHLFSDFCTALLYLVEANERIDLAVRAALTDAAPERRAAAGHVLARHRAKPERDQVRKLLSDAAPVVRFHTAEGLLLAREREAVPVLIALLADAPPALLWRLDDLLRRLAGEQAPPFPHGNASVAQRKECREAWEAWWKKQGDKVDLAKLHAAQPQLGLTLIIEYNTNRVWECDRDGKARWQLAGVTGPMEAWILGHDRVLLAEDQRITERDFAGKVLWELPVRDANNCQVLPNGNYFVSSYNWVSEYTRDAKRVYHHRLEPGSNGIRMSSRGTILCVRDRQIVEMDTNAKVLRTIPIPVGGTWVGLEELPQDRFLAANSGTGKVIEVDAKGKVLWETTVASACGVARLPSGNTLVATHGKLVEVDRGGKVVWERACDGYARRVHRR